MYVFIHTRYPICILGHVHMTCFLLHICLHTQYLEYLSCCTYGYACRHTPPLCALCGIRTFIHICTHAGCALRTGLPAYVCTLIWIHAHVSCHACIYMHTRVYPVVCVLHVQMLTLPTHMFCDMTSPCACPHE